MENLFNQVDALNNDDFEALIDHINKQKKRRANAILNEAKRQASRFMEDNNSTFKAKAPAKFRHPQNHELTWSGFGRKPLWFVEYIEKGGKEQDLVI